MVQLSLWGLLSQEGEALVRQSLRQPLLRELLRLPVLPRLLELAPSLLSVVRQQAAGSRQQAAGSRQQAAGITFFPAARPRLKMKNSDAPAVKREAEEDWSKERRR